MDLFKEIVNWEKLYFYSKLKNYIVVNGFFFKDFNKLDILFVKVFILDLEFKCCDEFEEV